MRSFLLRCAVAAGVAAGVAVTGAVTPAQAAVPVKVATPGGGVAGQAATCNHPVPPRGAIYNDSALARVGVGVIHLRDCTYGQGTHDTILPPEESTIGAIGWGQTAGIYIGGGYCSQLWYRSGLRWVRYGSDVRGPVQVFFPSGGDTKINPYRC